MRPVTRTNRPAPTPVPLSGAWARSGRAPLWVAVALYAAAEADPSTGVARLRAGELREALAPHTTANVVSAAIRKAVACGWLAEGSSAWRLILARPVSTY